MSQLGLPMSDERSPRRRREDRREGDRRHRRHGLIAVALALVVVAALLTGGYLGVRALVDKVAPTAASDYTGAGRGTVTVTVRKGDTVRDIGQRLVSAKVVASVDAFVAAADAEPDATGIQPGQYDLRRELPAASALAVLVDPASRQVRKVTLPEGRTLEASLTALAEGTGLPRAQLAAVAARPSGVGLPAWSRGKLQGFLYPATYEYERTVTARQAIGAAVERFDAAAADLRLVARARALGVSAYDVVTVASLIEAEAPANARGKVARVIYNRLDAGMRLGLDATVNYATGKTGSPSLDDLKDPSPYNTYVHTGLPPGAINSPGQAALDAALSPTKGQWLYYVTVDLDTGETKFAETEAGFQRLKDELTAWRRKNG